MVNDVPDGFEPLIPTYQEAPGSFGKRFVFTVSPGHEGEFGGMSVIVSMFDLGSEPHHSDLFVEYESTFGNSTANSDNRPPSLSGDSPMAKEYRAIAPRAVELMQTATKEQAATMTQELQDFRRRHPELYR
jgi:hypothetical protein